VFSYVIEIQDVVSWSRRLKVDLGLSLVHQFHHGSQAYGSKQIGITP